MFEPNRAVPETTNLETAGFAGELTAPKGAGAGAADTLTPRQAYLRIASREDWLRLDERQFLHLQRLVRDAANRYFDNVPADSLTNIIGRTFIVLQSIYDPQRLEFGSPETFTRLVAWQEALREYKRVVKNLVLEFNENVHTSQAAAESEEPTVGSVIELEERKEKRRLRETVVEAMALLSPDDQRLIELRLDGSSMEHVAEVLGVPYDRNVKMRSLRALDKLRKICLACTDRGVEDENSAA